MVRRLLPALIALAAWWLLLMSTVCPLLASDCANGMCPPIQRSPVQRSSGSTDISRWAQVCRVRVSLQDGTSGVGSGVWCHAPGYEAVVLSAAHVVRGHDGSPIVCYFPATGESLTGQVYREDRDLDLVSIQLRGRPRLKPIWIADTAPSLGDHITLAGMGGSPRKGFLAYAARATQWLASTGRATVANLLSVAVPSSQGDSGGPALNTQGQVVGIISASDHRMTVVVTGPRGGGLQALRDMLPPEPQDAPETVPIPKDEPEQAPVVDEPDEQQPAPDTEPDEEPESPPEQASTPTQTPIQKDGSEPADGGSVIGAVADGVASASGINAWTALAAALGIGGPLGLGIGVAGWLIGRRVRQRVIEHVTPPATDPPQEVGDTDSPFLGQRDISEAKQMLQMANDVEGRNAVLDALAGRVAMDWLTERTAPEARKGFARDMKDYIYRVIDQMAPLAIRRAA